MNNPLFHHEELNVNVTLSPSSQRVRRGTGELSALVEARYQLIRDTARCTSCGATRLDCEAQKGRDPEAPEWFGCCASGLDHWLPCVHVQDNAAVAALFQEIVAGEVRTVEEVEEALGLRPPIGPQGGPRPTWHWLLHQREWWAPKQGPMLKVHHMTDTHRLHSLRMLERNARNLAWSEHLILLQMASSPLGPRGDMAVDAVERALDELLEHPHEWLHGCELYGSLQAGLPVVEADHLRDRTSARATRLRERRAAAWNDLERRAEHWSACPANRDLRATCRCRVEHPVDPQVGPPVYDDPAFDPQTMG